MGLHRCDAHEESTSDLGVGGLALTHAQSHLEFAVGELGKTALGNPARSTAAETDESATWRINEAVTLGESMGSPSATLRTAAAIVLSFVLPTAFGILFGIVTSLKDAAPWIDLGTAQRPLFGMAPCMATTGRTCW